MDQIKFNKLEKEKKSLGKNLAFFKKIKKKTVETSKKGLEVGGKVAGKGVVVGKKVGKKGVELGKKGVKKTKKTPK